MEQVKRTPLNALLTATMAVSLLLRFLVMLRPGMNMLQSHLFGLVPVMLVFPVLGCSAVRRQTGLKLCAALTVWTVVSCLCAQYVESDLYTVLTSYFLSLVFLFLVCYPMAFVLGGDMPRAFSVVASVFVFGMTILCAVAVSAALTGVNLPSPNGPGGLPMGTIDQRLTMYCSSVAAGSYACMTILLTLLLLLRRPRPALFALYVLCLPIAYAAAALSDARIPIVCASVCVGGLSWLFATARLPIPKRAVRTATAFALAGAVILLFYFGTGLVVKGANAVSRSLAAPKESISAEAPADAPDAANAQADGEAQKLAKRSLLYGISSLNGRTDVWRSAIELFRHRPVKLLTGTSPVFVIAETQPYLAEDSFEPVYPHMHSLLFQTLTALGVPGLLLYAAVILYICYHALRVFFCGAGTCGLFERGVALIPLFYAVMDWVDISLWFAPPSSFTVLWFYFAGGYAVYLSTTRIPGRERKNRKAAGSGREANA